MQYYNQSPPYPIKKPPHTIVITYIDSSCPKKRYSDVHSFHLHDDVWYIRSMDGRFACEQNYLILRIETIPDGAELIDKEVSDMEFKGLDDIIKPGYVSREFNG